MLIRVFFFVFLTLFSLTRSAHADDYIAPTWGDLVKTLIRFNALNMTDMSLIDEYGLITECDLYKAFYRDDFKWNQVRQALSQSIKNDVATFPTRYRYVARWQLDRYDFQTKVFKFTDRSKISNVNSFVIYQVSGTPCEVADVKLIPRVFRAVIPEPVYMDGLPIGEEDAHNLVEQMKKDGNSDRVIWLRFNMRIVYIQPLVKTSRGKQSGVAGTYDDNIQYQQLGGVKPDTVRLDARLESIEAYEDQDLTKLIYNIQL